MFIRLTFPLLITGLLLLPACSTANSKKSSTAADAKVQVIASGSELDSILTNAKDRLLVFDLYADWCMPCKILSPLLEEIAKEKKDKATIYKINVDESPDIAAAFGVSGIPFVVFVKNKTGVHALTGVQPKDAYIRAIDRFAASESSSQDITPDGTLKDGKRIIRLSTATTPGNLYVYRGETVLIVIQKVDIPYSIAIPAFNVMKNGEVGKDLEVAFKADEVGVFPIFCNGKCPVGDGARYGQIVVMQYKSKGAASFTELTAEEAAKLIAEKKPFILDVRTPNEYFSGYLKDAYLLPLQQLDERLVEIDKYKDREVLVYCRSGNRSTVASQILIKKGFKKLYNLRPGIGGWLRAGKPVVKE